MKMSFKEKYFHTVAIACGVGLILGLSGVAEAGGFGSSSRSYENGGSGYPAARNWDRHNNYRKHNQEPIYQTVNYKHVYNNRAEGTVTNVQPMYKTVTRQVPTQRCTVVEVPVYERQGGGNHDKTGDILGGAIIGGIIGNNIGKGSGNGAAGAVIGGLLGNSHGDNRNRGSDVIVGYRQENRCVNEYHNETSEVLSHNSVTVDVMGLSHTFNTQRNYNVGDKVRMLVDIKPEAHQ
jgi:uncharacterized protein YcfJ